MNLVISELERGIKESLEKEALLGWIPGVSQLQNTSNALNTGVKYLAGGGLMSDLGNIGKAALPFLGMMGGKKGGGVGGAPQNISINLGNSVPTLGGNPSTVRTFGQMSQAAAAPSAPGPNIKVSGLLDLGLLRTVLTARTANEMIDTVKADKPNESQPAMQAPVNKAKVELTTKYPEIEKMLADPQSRAYLESLLTKDTGYGT